MDREFLADGTDYDSGKVPNGNTIFDCDIKHNVNEMLPWQIITRDYSIPDTPTMKQSFKTEEQARANARLLAIPHQTTL